MVSLNQIRIDNSEEFLKNTIFLIEKNVFFIFLISYLRLEHDFDETTIKILSFYNNFD